MHDLDALDALCKDSGDNGKNKSERECNCHAPSHRVLLNLALNSGYIVSAPPHIVSAGIFNRSVNCLIESFAPGKRCGTTPRGRTTSVTIVQGYGGTCCCKF